MAYLVQVEHFGITLSHFRFRCLHELHAAAAIFWRLAALMIDILFEPYLFRMAARQSNVRCSLLVQRLAQEYSATGRFGQQKQNLNDRDEESFQSVLVSH